MSGTPILSATGLTKRFGGGRTLFARDPVIHAVDNVSLAITAGETFAIVGESGCGKSTLARLLLRLIEPTAGQVLFDGEDVTAATPEKLRSLRRQMQIIFQDPFSSLNPRMSVGDLVGEPILTHGIAKGANATREINRVLDLVGLLPVHASRYPHEFSGGQRQRIGIARALASRPRLLVGDEPVSALDVSIRAQIINLLQDLKHELKLTLVLVSHDLGVVQHAADRVAVMYLGEIVELADAASLFAGPRHPYTQALMAAAPTANPAGRKDHPLLEGDPPSPAKPPAGCRFHTRCPHAKDRCATERPVLRPAASGHGFAAHTVACHRMEEIGAAEGLNDTSLSPQRRARVALFAAASRTR